MEDRYRKRNETEFFSQLSLVFGIDGYAITPELLEYVSQNPHIGSYNWNAGLQAFQPDREVDNALKSITQAQLEQLRDRNNEEPIRIAEGVNISLNANGTININGRNEYFFYKTPKSRIEKTSANDNFPPSQRRIFREAREAVAAARERAGGAMDIDDNAGKAEALGGLELVEFRPVKKSNINQDEEIAAALAEFNLDEEVDKLGGKRNKKSKKINRKYKKSKKTTKKSRRRTNKKSKKNKK